MKANVFEVDGNYLGEIGKITKIKSMVEVNRFGIIAAHYPDTVFNLSMTPRNALFTVNYDGDLESLKTESTLRKAIIESWADELQTRLELHETFIKNYNN